MNSNLKTNETTRAHSTWFDQVISLAYYPNFQYLLQTNMNKDHFLNKKLSP